MTSSEKAIIIAVNKKGSFKIAERNKQCNGKLQKRYYNYSKQTGFSLQTGEANFTYFKRS
jgi:hypothetical protein